MSGPHGGGFVADAHPGRVRSWQGPRELAAFPKRRARIRANEEEVRRAGRSCESIQTRGEAISPKCCRADLPLEFGGEVQGHIQGFQARRRDGVGKLERGESPHQRGIADQITQTPRRAGEGLRESAKQQEIREALGREAVRARREFGVGLVQHDEDAARFRRAEQGLDGFRIQPRATGIVGQREPELARLRVERFEPRLKRETIAHRNARQLSAIPLHEQRVEGEAGLGHGDRVPFRKSREGDEVQQRAAGRTQQHAARGRAEAESQPFRELALPLRILAERQLPQARQERVPRGRGPVVRGLIHVQARESIRFVRPGVGAEVIEIGSEVGHGCTERRPRESKRGRGRKAALGVGVMGAERGAGGVVGQAFGGGELGHPRRHGVCIGF